MRVCFFIVIALCSVVPNRNTREEVDKLKFAEFTVLFASASSYDYGYYC